MTEPQKVLESARRILIVDWPSRDVPDTLAGAGYAIFMKGGAAVLALEPVDMVYVHRPLAELEEIVATANSLGARAVWYQSGLTSTDVKDPKGCWLPEDASRAARALVESAGMQYVDDVYIADAVRRLRVMER